MSNSFDLWSEYQKMRVKYPTDDISQWSENDRKRAKEINQIIADMSGAEIRLGFLEKCQGEKKGFFKRKLKAFFRGSR